MSKGQTAKVAVVYHSGYGHTEVLAKKVAEGVVDGGAEVVLLKIESPVQDFDPLLTAASDADAIVFGAPTYMGDVSAPFKAFADASAKVFFTGGWKDKLAAGFTNSHSFAGDKSHALESLTILAAQHGMNWINLGIAPPNVTAAERGPDTINRVGSFIGLAGSLYLLGFNGLAFIMGWTGGYCLVALFLAPYLRKFGQFTIPDFLGARYGGNLPRMVGVVAVILHPGGCGPDVQRQIVLSTVPVITVPGLCTVCE